MKIGTIATGVGVATTINLQFLPQFLYWVDPVTPQALRVNVQGDGIVTDLDTAGINAINGMRLLDVPTNGKLIPLANGIVKNKNVEITFTNGVANTIDVYGISIANNGNVYMQSIKNSVIAASGVEIRKFAFLSLANAAATDIINITYQDGLTQLTALAELDPVLAMVESNVNGTNVQAIDNFDGRIKVVQFTPTATQVIHVVRFLTVGDVSQSIQ